MSDLNLHHSSKSAERHHMREDQFVTAYAKAWAFFDSHRTLVYGVLAVLVLAVAGVIAYTMYLEQQQEKAQQLLAEPVQLYENGQFREALDGVNNGTGLLAIADEYGNTDAGNLARFYAADALYQLGEYDQALAFFSEFDKEDNLLGASAIAGEAAVYENKGEFGRAAELYRRAADYVENELTTPQYLFSAARAYEQADQYEDALEVYEAIQERFPEAVTQADIDLFIARVHAKQSNPS
jgi:tetratricopeptide (TPR) repeat protein